MRGIGALLAEKATAGIAGGLIIGGLSAVAQSVPHLSVTQPGGMPGMPVVTGIEPVSNGVSVTWDGPSGYYRVFQKQDLRDAAWHPVSSPSLARQATITALHSNAFFRVSGPAPRYAGSAACAECHDSIHNLEMNTRHAGAFTNALFVAFGGQTNGSCLPCHTVGYGLPTGFINATATPHLSGVQCENCHGPAAGHAANESDPTVRPRVELAATVCGGCHTGSHHPTYDEWKSSGHSTVTEDMNPASTINSCGRCHSGSARLSLLKNDPLPAGDANVAIGCVTCHDPHQNTVHPAQLRSPISSTNDYYITTSAAFTDQYNPDINICAQCHNHRGASASVANRPPHHSPQYNILLGTVGELTAGPATFQPAAHAIQVTNQCVACHMPEEEFQDEAHPAVTGHSFRVERFDRCLACHPFMPELLVAFTQTYVSNQIQQVKGALDLWGATRSPMQLRTNYGVRAWEYTAPGTLSTGTDGPSGDEQSLIPLNIRKARFNLYLVFHDGSYGVHNGPFSIMLLDTAAAWVQQELNGPDN
jgi:hypothetical protein